MKTKIILTVLATTLSASSFADSKNKGGFFVEPMVTYEKGNGEINLPAPFSNSDTKINGFGVGARLGFHIMESIFIGADGRYSMPTYKSDGLDQKTQAKAWNYGPFAGVQTPTDIGLRVWAGYIMGAQLDPDTDKSVNLKFTDGSGYRVGAGIKLGITSLNLEYQDLTYDKTTVEEVGVFSPGYASNKVDHKNSSWVLSVSFPLSL